MGLETQQSNEQRITFGEGYILVQCADNKFRCTAYVDSIQDSFEDHSFSFMLSQKQLDNLKTLLVSYTSGSDFYLLLRKLRIIES